MFEVSGESQPARQYDLAHPPIFLFDKFYKKLERRKVSRHGGRLDRTVACAITISSDLARHGLHFTLFTFHDGTKQIKLAIFKG